MTAALTGLHTGHDVLRRGRGDERRWHDDGSILSFTTLAPPTATTQAATGVTTTAATLNGSVNPEGQRDDGHVRVWDRPDPEDRNDDDHEAS